MKTANEVSTSGKVPETWSPLLELATREVFEIMLGCKLETGDGVAQAAGDFTAMVGIAGQLCGLLTLRCSAHSAAVMASKMVGGDIKESDPQMWDAVGEIANMIAGNFKNKLTGMGDGCLLSVPTVITGTDYSFRSMADTGPLQVTILFESSPITVSVEIHS
ncbi:MAG TPA: chemotaxis protein CheX [Terriglobales bacterium]|jgi:CheY-specific phosphatase CheX|nr:chemotaxis protein CheX [Terriglobales bacterium]